MQASTTIASNHVVRTSRSQELTSETGHERSDLLRSFRLEARRHVGVDRERNDSGGYRIDMPPALLKGHGHEDSSKPTPLKWGYIRASDEPGTVHSRLRSELCRELDHVGSSWELALEARAAWGKARRLHTIGTEPARGAPRPRTRPPDTVGVCPADGVRLVANGEARAETVRHPNATARATPT